MVAGLTAQCVMQLGLGAPVLAHRLTLAALTGELAERHRPALAAAVDRRLAGQGQRRAAHEGREAHDTPQPAGGRQGGGCAVHGVDQAWGAGGAPSVVGGLRGGLGRCGPACTVAVAFAMSPASKASVASSA